MSEPLVQVPESWVAVFHATSLPGHPANPDADQVIEWPQSAGGVPFMPMSGRFIVRDAAGDVPREDGFLTVGGDGHPVWSAEPPA